jgi:tetratricopeptide (TPR) repeat protein
MVEDYSQRPKSFFKVLPLLLISLLLHLIPLNQSFAKEFVSLPSDTQSNPNLEKAKSVFLNYYKNPMILNETIGILEGVLKQNPGDVDTLIFLSRVWLTYGFVKAENKEERIFAFRNGKEIAQKAIDIAPNNPDAHFFFVANLSTLGQTQGILKSLFMLPRVRKEIDTILTLDPDHAYGIAMQGLLFTYLPPILGGDLKIGESYLRRSVMLDPHTSSTKIYLGINLKKQKRYDEAKEVFKEIIDEKNPKVYPDWYMNQRWARWWIARLNKKIKKEKGRSAPK